MIVGIVGSEAAKFTKLGEQRAKDAIESIIMQPEFTGLTSGHCHLGGIDIWAEELGDQEGLDLFIYPPKVKSWELGYKPRNLAIANKSDMCYCISVDKLPEEYVGMKFKTCYHCANAGRNATDHVKSGGCWTVIQAMKLGKEGRWITVENY